jgi:uncharacterized protein (TIGR02466 family)
MKDNMELIPIFSNFVVIDELSLDNSEIQNYSRKVCEGVINYNFGRDDEVMRNLYSIVDKKLNDVHTKIGLSKEYHQVISNSWINPSIVKLITTPHNHPRCCFSAVYYVSATINSGDLILLNPNAQHTQVFPSQDHYNCIEDYNSITGATFGIKPKTGTLLIFPSWLFHYVEVGDGSDRISVAFDSIILKK